MIRRNTANQTIYLPCLKLTVDGAAVTSAATLTVAKDGTESASAGTLAHSAGGVWKYTPTQGETDAAIVALILTATGADPVVLNCVTTGADTSAVALGANTTTPANSTIASIYALVQLTDADVASIVTLLGTPAGASIAADLIAIKTSADAALRPTTAGRTLNVNTDGEGEAVLDSATSTKIDSILEDTGTTLPGLIDAIPKVGSTHRYTQIAQTSTTTDVSIGEAT